jgi:hypothetical protein
MSILELSLPNDIIYHICKYVDAKDIYNLQHTNKNIQYKIRIIQNDIMSQELQKRNKNYLKKNTFYNCLNFYLITNLNKCKMKSYNTGSLEYRNYYLFFPESEKTIIINKLFSKIFNFYIYNDSTKFDTKLYKNKIELLILYNLLETNIFPHLPKHYFFTF